MPQVAARLWGKVPEQSYLPELAATSQELRDYADKLGAAVLRPGRAVRVARLVRCRRRTASRSRSCRCAPRRRSACSALGSADAERFHPGMGTRVPDAPRRARERGDVALPAAGVERARSRCARRRRPTIAPPAIAPSNAAHLGGVRRASRVAPRAHARRLSARRHASSPTLAGETDLAAPSPRGAAGGSSRRCTAAGLSGRSLARMLSAWRAFYGFAAASAIRRCSDNPCAGLKAPKAREAAARRRCRPTKRCGSSTIDGDEPLARARPRAVRARVFVRACACPSSPASTSIASISRRAKCACWGKGAKERDRSGRRRGARRRSARGSPSARELPNADPKAMFVGAQRQAHHAARDRAPARRVGGAAGARPPRASAHAAAFVRLARAAVVGRPARGAGDAGPREHREHAGVHAPRLPVSRQGLRRGASARAKRKKTASSRWRRRR